MNEISKNKNRWKLKIPRILKISKFQKEKNRVKVKFNIWPKRGNLLHHRFQRYSMLFWFNLPNGGLKFIFFLEYSTFFLIFSEKLGKSFAKYNIFCYKINFFYYVYSTRSFSNIFVKNGFIISFFFLKVQILIFLWKYWSKFKFFVTEISIFG